MLVQYEDLPVIVSIEAAICAQSFYSPPSCIESGAMQLRESEATHVVTGTLRVGGQEHFYLETQCSFAIPSEGRCLEIFTSGQSLQFTQAQCASVCGLEHARVVVRCKRMGGGSLINDVNAL